MGSTVHIAVEHHDGVIPEGHQQPVGGILSCPDPLAPDVETVDVGRDGVEKRYGNQCVGLGRRVGWNNCFDFLIFPASDKRRQHQGGNQECS